jgi:hypothetical protein
MRRAARLDSNHVQIASGLVATGHSVLSLAPLGRGVPDLLVSRNGLMWLMDAKSPGAPTEFRPGARSHNAQTAARQEEFSARWRAPVYFVRSLAEALKITGAA